MHTNPSCFSSHFIGSSIAIHSWKVEYKKLSNFCSRWCWLWTISGFLYKNAESYNPTKVTRKLVFKKWHAAAACDQWIAELSIPTLHQRMYVSKSSVVCFSCIKTPISKIKKNLNYFARMSFYLGLFPLFTRLSGFILLYLSSENDKTSKFTDFYNMLYSSDASFLIRYHRLLRDT